MKRIFVDSSFWYAVTVKDDKNHERSASAMRRLQAEGDLLYTSDLVIAETQRLILYKIGKSAGRLFVRQALIQVDRGFLKIVSATTVTLRQALALIEKFKEQDLSITDACSAIFMHQERIDQVASFDRHFRILGFPMLPD